MAKRQPPSAGLRNRFLARLPEAEYRRLMPLLQPVTLTSGQVLYEARGPIEYAYFPIGAVLSALTVMQNGNAIEVRPSATRVWWVIMAPAARRRRTA